MNNETREVSTFIRNTWYIAAHSAAVTQQPLARIFLGEAIVLFRTGDGGVVALEDCCAHRLLPLSKGKVVEDAIVCGYHGATYDASGSCIRIPGHGAIPSAARVRSYPVVDRYGCVWIWMGDPEQANEDSIPSMFQVVDDPEYQATDGETLSLGAHYHLLTDNLMDASHAEFVHPTTVGSGGLQVTRGEQQGESENSFEVDVGEHEIAFKIRLRNGAAGRCFHNGLAIKLGVESYDEPLDWHLNVLWTPPAYFMFHHITMAAGTSSDDGVAAATLTGLTPESSTSTHYFWKIVQQRRYGEKLAEFWQNTIIQSHSEDVEVLELQQQKIGNRELHDCNIVSFQGDQLGLQLRKIVERLARQEREQR